MVETTRPRSHSPEFALLGFLYEQPSHGYALHQRLTSELGNAWHASQSQTYNILKRLEAQGDVSSTTQDQVKLPPRRILQITEAGRKRFEEWLETPCGGSVRAIRLEFISRLYFSQKLFPGTVKKLIELEANDIQGALTRLELSRRTLPPDQVFNRLSLELRIQQLRAVRDWVNTCHKAFER